MKRVFETLEESIRRGRFSRDVAALAGGAVPAPPVPHHGGLRGQSFSYRGDVMTHRPNLVAWPVRSEWRTLRPSHVPTQGANL